MPRANGNLIQVRVDDKVSQISFFLVKSVLGAWSYPWLGDPVYFFSLENVVGIVRTGVNWCVRKAGAAMKSKCAEVSALPD